MIVAIASVLAAWCVLSALFAAAVARVVAGLSSDEGDRSDRYGSGGAGGRSARPRRAAPPKWHDRRRLPRRRGRRTNDLRLRA
jgi:hypothetical protein